MSKLLRIQAVGLPEIKNQQERKFDETWSVKKQKIGKLMRNAATS